VRVCLALLIIYYFKKKKNQTKRNKNNAKLFCTQKKGRPGYNENDRNTFGYLGRQKQTLHMQTHTQGKRPRKNILDTKNRKYFEGEKTF
jgi:hypothetical protein